MFVSDSHLPQLLPPEAYHDPAWHRRELDRVLRPCWWAVAALDELPHDGSFVTFDHVGGPVILRRSGSSIRGYRNVCPHRLAKVCGQARGVCATLTCDYHGWQFDDSGATRRIPDAPSFRPLEKGRLGLDVLRVETVGGIVFLSFDTDAPPVREWLGDEAERIEARFGPRTRTLYRVDIDIPVNWKLVVENNLESYHVSTVHAATLGGYPDEAACRHDLAPGRSRFTGPGGSTAWTRLRIALAGSLGRTTGGQYTHSIVHPAFTWLCVDLLSGFQSIVPTGHRSCRMTVRFGTLQAERPRPVADGAARLAMAGELRFWRRVIAEDLAVLPQVQAGLESPGHPGPGLISRREERIVHFQRWLLQRLGADPAGREVAAMPAPAAVGSPFTTAH
jgi:phenylpropionate dioxygenase-like ring-hydroxylating dioxygenase large terminal subunit